MGGRVQGATQGDDVTFAEQCREIWYQCYPLAASFYWVEVWVVRKHPHAKPVNGDPGTLSADESKTDDAQRLATQDCRETELVEQFHIRALLAVAMCATVGDRDQLEQGECDPKYMLGDFDEICSSGVHHRHAIRRSGIDIDVFGARRRTDDDAQAGGGLDQLAVTRVAPEDRVDVGKHLAEAQPDDGHPPVPPPCRRRAADSQAGPR